MAIGVTLLVVGVLVAAIWTIIELKRLKHKIFAIFLICLILFTYFSFSAIINTHDVDLKSVEGLTEAGRLYFVWIGALFGNFKSITSHAVKLDWQDDGENLISDKE